MNVFDENVLTEKVNAVIQELEEQTEINGNLTYTNITEALEMLKGGLDNATKSLNSLENDFNETLENIDPINYSILSEEELMNESKSINCSVETYGKVVKTNGNQTIDEVKQAFREELVDNTIIKNNPIYNYKLYGDSNKSRMLSVGAFVVNDYENVEVNDEETTTYWQIKILTDVTDSNIIATATDQEAIEAIIWNGEESTPTIPRLSVRTENNERGDTIVNNKYYIAKAIIVDLNNNDTFELFVKQGDEFVSANMFIEIFKSSMFTKRHRAGSGKKPRVVYTKYHEFYPVCEGPMSRPDIYAAVTVITVQGRQVCYWIYFVWNTDELTLWKYECKTV